MFFTKRILLIAVFHLICYTLVAQDFNNKREGKRIKDILINTSYVNMGVIDHFNLYLNFDSRRYYMYYGLGVEARVTNNLSFRLDYFSNYSNFNDLKNIFNPSVLTFASRVYFNKSERTRPFFDFKVGIAITEGHVEPYPMLVSSIPFVGGFKTGIVSQISNRFSLGFSIDNFGIIYRYTDYPDSKIYTDASRFSMITTDIYYHIFKKE